MAKAKKATKKAKTVKKAKPKAAKAKKAAPKKAKPKAAPKAPKKAAAKKKRISLGTYDMQDTPEESHFYFVNGHKVKNVKELAEVMDRIEQEIFDFHVNPDKNDFYNWVRHVFDDLELAEKMVGVTGPKHLQFTIYKHVADKAMKKK
ncbi:hypothetical protein GOV07_01660 [Candidatus Woesearchaeota archaeon]|nr:hypothetical protein [Candidatus Woesearchaeota archaeon]